MKAFFQQAKELMEGKPSKQVIETTIEGELTWGTVQTGCSLHGVVV